MKRLLLLILLAGLCTGAMAQQSGQTLSLDQCIQYALENSVQAKNALLDQEKAKYRVKEITGMGLPQISGEASVTHNEKLQRFFMAYSSQGGFIDFGPNVPPGLQEGDVIAAPNFFQLKSAGNASVTANQLIFNGSYFVGLKVAKAYKDLAIKSADATNESIIQQVTVAYYNVLINKEREALFNSNIARVDSLLKTTTALNKNGFAEAIDVDRIQVTLNNLKTEHDKVVSLNEVGIYLLKFQMN
jgi:outer membrane protein TolC